MYEFVTGPLAWLAFIVFFVGNVVKLVLYVRGLDWKLDRVTYSVNTAYGVRGALRSIAFWLVPYGTQSYRNNPGFTLALFVMHIGLILTPILLLGHNILFEERASSNCDWSSCADDIWPFIGGVDDRGGEESQAR